MKSFLAILRRGVDPRRLALSTFGLIVLGSGFYGWLRLPDSTVLYLSLQVVGGVFLLAVAGALVSGVVGSLAGVLGTRRIRAIVRRAPLGSVVVIVAGAFYWLVGWLEDAGAKRIYIVASWLSFHLDRAVPIPPFRTAWEILFLFVDLVLLPALLIGIYSRWLRRRSAAPATRRTNFFLFLAVAIVMAALFDWLPWQLAWWAPALHAPWAEVLSAALRLATAGLLFSCGLVIQWSWYIGPQSN